MKSFPILIDCDPGADDTFALLWALTLHSKDNNPLQIKAITTSGGNVSADKTYLNAHRMCQFVKVNNIPIGKDLRPITSKGDASHIHGNDGIGNLSRLLPDATKSINFPVTPLDSMALLIQTIKENPGLIILATGPMTNFAAAEQQEPGILNQCRSIIAMGGVSKIWGNVTPVAEFNIRYDAPAAQYVSTHCENLVMIPLDVTTSFVYSPLETEHILWQINHSEKAEFLRQLTVFTIGTNKMFRETAYKDGFFVHDAHTVGFLMYPHLYKGSLVDLNVETVGEYTRGQTVIDRRNHSRTGFHKTMWITDVDKMWFLEAMIEDLKQFDFSE